MGEGNVQETSHLVKKDLVFSWCSGILASQKTKEGKSYKQMRTLQDAFLPVEWRTFFLSQCRAQIFKLQEENLSMRNYSAKKPWKQTSWKETHKKKKNKLSPSKKNTAIPIPTIEKMKRKIEEK